MTLLGFILACLDEDQAEIERQAAEKEDAGWWLNTRPRLLAEIESKRAILDQVFKVAAKIDGEWGCCHSSEGLARVALQRDEGLPSDCDGLATARPFLQQLARPYADRPGFDGQWRP